MTDQMDLFPANEPAKGVESMNPMVKAYGHGPEGAICKTCSHLLIKHYAGTYRKCEYRKNTNSSATDHRVRWPACSKYENIQYPEEG